MSYSAYLGLLLLCSTEAVDISPSVLIDRIDSVSKSVKSFDAQLSLRWGKLDIQRFSGLIGWNDWESLSGAASSWDISIPIVIERDLGASRLYYSFNLPATNGSAKEYYFDQQSCAQAWRTDLSPTVMIQKDVFKECLDESNLYRWDMLWLRPLRGASISDAIRQATNPFPIAPLQERFRLNGVVGAPGDRLVDVSLQYLQKSTSSRPHKVVEENEQSAYEIRLYRMLLSEKYDFMPRCIAELSVSIRDMEIESELDGDPITIVVYDEYERVNGVPVPHVMGGYSRSTVKPYSFYETRLESVALNESANVRNRFEIPAGSTVIDDTRDSRYQQVEQSPRPDEDGGEAPKKIERLEGERTGAGSDPPTQSFRSVSYLNYAIGFGVFVGSAAIAVWAFRKRG